MNTQLNQAISQALLAWADDELILAHRNSEWTGHGPILEEDIAFSNISQDELGHATIWYNLLEQITEHSPDQLVFFREPFAYRNIQMMELPKGDWAFSMLRQYLFDAYETIHLPHLSQSHYQPIADAAAKIRVEELYHLRHTTLWVKRLGLGTEESHTRMQKALNTLWPFAQQLFVPLPQEALLVEANIIPETAVLHQAWLNTVQPTLTEANLHPPDTPPSTRQREQHTEHLADLLQEMQMVARLDPQAEW